MSRRQFLGLAGASAAGIALGGCAASRTSTQRVVRYRSRPDLQAPRVVVRRAEADEDMGYILVTPSGPLILDHTGSPVWIRPVDEATTNLQVQSYGGKPVLTWWEGTVTKYGIGRGHGVLFDDRYRQIARIDAARGLNVDLHELCLTERGSAYITAARLVEADLGSVGGPRRATMVDSWVQEIDVASGSLLFEWRATDHVQLAESMMTPATSDPFDPVHLNSIQELADGNLLVSARNTWALYMIDRRTGAILWRLGGKRSDFELSHGAVFAWQHDARLQENGSISLFDDEASPKVRSQSRALILDVDWGARKVSLGRQYLHPSDPLLAGSQGSMQPLSGGDVFVGWGAQPYFSQFRRDGSTVLDGHLLKGTSYRAFRSPWTGLPTDRPALVLEPHDDAMSVFVSWNGSTQTARWRVRGGRPPSSFHTLATAARAGFETAIHGVPPAPRVVVDALSVSGDVLATSHPVTYQRPASR